jgi:hypothetical protein
MPRLCALGAGALIVFLGLALPAQASTILEVNGSGILTGARNVNVNGTLYDVTFADGSCVDLFGGCTSSSDFTFTTFADAQAAATALGTQVFVDTGSYSFDSDPYDTFGCSFSFSCTVGIPFAPGGTDVELAWVDNFYSGSNFISTSVEILPTTYDTTGSATPQSSENWAVFSPATTPVPPSLPLLATGLVGLALLLWRRQAKNERLPHAPA